MAKAGYREDRRGAPPKAAGRLTLDQYNDIVRAYHRRRSVEYVIETTGFARETVIRYLNHGDPFRGWPPGRDRIEETDVELIQVADKAFTQRAAEVTAQLETLRLGVVEQLIKRLYVLCVGCGEGAEDCTCETGFAPMPMYEATIADLGQLSREEFKWAGGNVFEQAAIGGFMGVVMLTVANVLRGRGLDGEVEPTLKALGEQLSGLTAKGVRKVAEEEG